MYHTEEVMSINRETMNKKYRDFRDIFTGKNCFLVDFCCKVSRKMVYYVSMRKWEIV